MKTVYEYDFTNNVEREISIDEKFINNTTEQNTFDLILKDLEELERQEL